MRPSERKTIGFLLLLCCLVLTGISTVRGQAATGEATTRFAADTSAAAKNLAISPDQLLQGRLSGVRVFGTEGNPLGALVTQIRGANSVRGNSDPLWIVDGVMLNASQLDGEAMFWKNAQDDYTSVQNTLATINPNDIESIEVLKNLSATALYGARGANGVVIVRTRQAGTEKFRITWRSNFTLSTPVKSDDRMLGLTDYRDFQQRLGNDVPTLDGEVDWQDRMLKSAFSHSHNVSVSGAERRFRYYLSANFKQVDGVVPGNDDYLGGFRLNFDMNASKLFSIGARLGFGYANLNMSKGTNPLGQESMVTLIHTAAPALNAPFSPDTWQRDYDDNSEEYRLLPNIYFTLNFLPGLKLVTDFGIDYRGKDRLMWLGNGTVFGKASNGAGALSTLTAFQFNASSVLSYERTVAKHHHLSASAGVEAFGNRHISDVMSGEGFSVHELRAKGINGFEGRAYPHKFDMKYNQLGFLARIGYSYNDMISVDLSARMDRVKKYDDHYTCYPAANVDWNVRNTLMPRSKVVSKLNLRGGWGKAARERAVPYELYGNYYTGTVEAVADAAVYPFFDTFMRTTGREYNAGLEIGFAGNRVLLSAGYYDRETTDDFRIYKFGSKNKGETAKYWNYTPRETWHGDRTVISNRGVEGDLSVQAVRTRDWQWDLNFNVATNRNRVVELGKGDALGRTIGAGSESVVNANKVGWPSGSIYGFKYKGVVNASNLALAPAFRGTPASIGDALYQDRTGDDDITDEDRVIIGNPHPKVFGGFNTRVAWRRLSMAVALDFAAGHNILNLDRMMRENVSGAGNITFDSYRRAVEAQTSDEPLSPRFGAQGTTAVSNRYVEKGDYLRLGNITLAYRLPVERVKWIGSMEVYLNVRNVCVFSSYSGNTDPDVSCYGVDNGRQGIAYGAYPRVRSFTFGINTTF